MNRRPIAVTVAALIGAAVLLGRRDHYLRLPPLALSATKRTLRV